MSDSSPSRVSQKPNPKFLSYAEAMKQYRITSGALRLLCDVMLDVDGLPPHARSSLLSLVAALPHEEAEDGET